MVILNPPKLPCFLPLSPKSNTPETHDFFQELGGWEDKPYTPAHPHMRRARVRVYVSILPYSQKEIVYKGFKVVGPASVREGGLGRGRFA